MRVEKDETDRHAPLNAGATPPSGVYPRLSLMCESNGRKEEEEEEEGTQQGKQNSASMLTKNKKSEAGPSLIYPFREIPSDFPPSS